MKQIVVGGDCTEEEAESLGGRFLGVGYNPKQDFLEPKTNPAMRVAVKRRAKLREEDIVVLDEKLLDDIEMSRLPLTRRRVLAFQMGQFDPLGHISPVTLKGKLLVQKLTLNSPNLKWDEPLNEKDSKDWRQYMEIMLNLEGVKLPRSIVVA